MADIATSIAVTIFDHSLGAIVRQVGYLWNHKKNMADLKSQVEKLDKVRNDQSHSVLAAQRNAERVREVVEGWQEEAKTISEEARKIMEKYEANAKMRCLIGLCPNLVSHYQSSRRACKQRVEIVEATTKAAGFNGVSDRAVHRVTSTLSTEGYFSFNSRNSTLEEIVKALQDATKNSIGVYGLGGIGKTTLVKQVASRAAEEKMFEEIVMAPVTQTPELKEIQGQIAKMLDLKLEDVSVAERAGPIRDRLKEKKVLVILDDLWKVVDLEKVGIPFGAAHMGCKILLTSRFQDVLSSMGTKTYFNVEALGEDEAWSLFRQKTNEVIKDPAFLAVGKEVAKRCAGVPVLIVTVAASLSSTSSLPVWKNALKDLEKMNNKEIHEIIHSAMESISYKHLGKTHKRLFLLCGLLGSGTAIADLLKYILGWGFFDEGLTVDEARNKLHALIHDLKGFCLWLDGGDDEDIVEMHDVVRGVAIQIARKDLNMISAGDNDSGLSRWPKDDVLNRCTAMVVDDCRDLPCLVERLECPSLEFFCMDGYSQDSSPAIPHTFFERTKKLQVLDMSRRSFPRLPSSLSFLENLQTLRLDYCRNLEDISIVGESKNLQVLSLIYSGIKELPREIGQLSGLRLLDLSNCSELEVIPAGLIAGLFKLEELYMSRSFNRWEGEECSSIIERRNVSLAELKDLRNLRTLEIEVLDSKLLSKDLNFEKLERYEIIVGDLSIHYIWMEIDSEGISRAIGLQLGGTSINHLHGVKSLLRRTQSLCLQEPNGIKNVIHELDADGFPELKHLNIQTNSEIQYIINVEVEQLRAFTRLESLQLRNLLKLEKICNGRLMEGSFCYLKTVKVQECDKLESLFSFSMAIGLPCLQEIEISDCSILKEIVTKKSREDNYVNTHGVVIKCDLLEEVFAVRDELDIDQERDGLVPKLIQLSLADLPKLRCVWSKYHLLSFKNLQQLTVETCGSLKYLFTTSISMGLVRLQELTITGCEMMKEVVSKEEGETTTDTIIFPQLNKICLEDMPNLTTFFSGRCVLFPSLKDLKIERCQQLKTFCYQYAVGDVIMSRRIEENESYEKLHAAMQPLFHEKVNFPSLESMIINDVGSISTWNYKIPEVSSCNITQLTIEKCDCLKYLFTPSVATGLVQLQELTVKSCVMMKEIVAMDEGEKRDSIIFPQLRSLCLEDLPKLTTFFSGVVEMDCNENIYTATQPLFKKKANFSRLESLTIKNLDNIQNIWHNQFHGEDSFCRLKTVSVESCANLLKIFPYTMPGKIQSMTNIEIDDCGALEDIFAVQEGLNLEENMDNVTTVLQLAKLWVKNLPKLRCVWNLDLLKILNFQNLCEVWVDQCHSLHHLFPASMAKYLHQLETLNISNCKGVETIVDGGGDDENEGMVEEVPTTFMFPKLSTFRLFILPRLRSFYPKKYIIKWPVLLGLDVSYCNQVSFMDFLSFPEKQGEDQFEKLLSNLNNLTMRGKDVMKMEIMRKDGHFPPEPFHNLVTLKMDDFHDEWSTFPFKSLYRFHNLVQLVVNDCSFQEIISYEGDEGDILNDTVAFAQLTDLELYLLPELKHIWKEDSPFIPIPEKLQVLRIWKCPRLKNLLPRSVSFKFLRSLFVKNCAGLTNLFHSSTARSLKQLEWLEIIGCEMIEEVIASEVDDSEDEMIFSRLTYLELGNLPRLTSFCASSCTFSFPLLCAVVVRQCPNMRTFSGGMANTLELENVSLTGSDDDDRWNGDLNTTIQQIFTEMEVQRLASTDPSISSNNHLETEAQIHEKPIESAEKEVEVVFDEFTELRKEDGICENGIGEVGNNAEISKEAPKPGYEADICENLINPEKESGISENATEPRKGVEIFEKRNEPRKETDICEEVIEGGKVTDIYEKGKGKELKICEEEVVEPSGEKSHTYCQSHDNSSFRTLQFNQHEESSLPTEQQSERSQETPLHSDPSSLCPANEPEEQTYAGFLAPQNAVASISSQLIPAINYPETSPSLVTEAGTSRATSKSQQWDFQGFHVTIDFITLLSKVLQVLQIQPRNNIIAEEVQFMEEACRDLSNMNFPMEWLCPYVEKARKCISVVERMKTISELELKIAETRAQLQALEENKKALEEESGIIVSTMNLDKPLYDD